MPEHLPRFSAILGLGLAVCFAVNGLSLMHRDISFGRAQTEISFWGRGNYSPSPNTLENTGSTLARLLESAPQSADYLGLNADFLIWRAYLEKNPARSAAYAEEAVARLYAALESRPAHLQHWAKMVEYGSRSDGGSALVNRAKKRLQNPRLKSVSGNE